MTTLKKMSCIAASVIALSFISCSSDDATDGNENNTPDTTSYNLLPLTISNNWTYDVETIDADGTTQISTSTDVVNLDGTLMLNNKEYSDYSTSLGSTGFMSGVFDQNNFRTENEIYYMKGSFDLPLSQLGGTDLSINIDDAKLIDPTSNPDTILSEVNGATNQNIQGIELEVTYGITTVQNETLSTYNVNGTDYSNVVASSIIINARATTPVSIGPITQNIEVMAAQDIYVIKNYYADGIGLIDSQATFSYQLIDVSEFIQLPIPTTGGNTTAQKINTYTVN